ncbi:acid phosphatase phoa [Viridothelium virens]|uniref:Acid phosphatase phoa n=1 Tax=Viridothelium virens TaxID=1048519 RepID=A0A6A6H0U5_VIRVR|nr:acid phosphatase phoa [Viridothelium virens]
MAIYNKLPADEDADPGDVLPTDQEPLRPVHRSWTLHTFISILTFIMLSAFIVAALALAGGVVTQNTQTSASDVYAAQATAKTAHPTSNVAGAAFQRFVVIWLENTDYDKASGDPNLAYLAQKGITLSNYFALTHPSEPNYVASIGGDNFGMDNDDFNQVPGNVSTIIDLLEDRGISWSMYQEDMPYSGFEGYSWVNQQTQANDYVRKHNPAIIYNANTTPDRLAKNKNLTMFYEDLKTNRLPQWMFITPNMTDDGHDTSVTVAGTWTRAFVEPLLNDTRFMQNTTVLITFDENHTYTQQNRVLGILLGDAVPKELIGTTDSNFYDHYSEIATVEANWGLNTLGRWDVGANVFSWVADKVQEEVRPWDAATNAANPSVFLNQSFIGPFSDTQKGPLPVPNTNAEHSGRKVLPKIKDTWGAFVNSTYYTTGVEVPDGLRPPQGWAITSS